MHRLATTHYVQTDRRTQHCRISARSANKSINQVKTRTPAIANDRMSAGYSQLCHRS